MTRDDRPTDPPDGDDPRDEDPDRAAILARRRRFIAIALSGLAVGATTGCPEPAQPATPPDGGVAPGDARPEACLKVAPPQEPTPTEPPPPKDPEPTPCLKVAAPPEPAPEPAPCLKVAPPPPKEPEPQPCLSVKPRSDNEGRPQPCLKVARPKSD